MRRTVVFLQTPSVLEEPATANYRWTIHPKSETRTAALLYPPAALEAAGRRLSALYENVIFQDQAPLDDLSDSDNCVDGGQRGGEWQIIPYDHLSTHSGVQGRLLCIRGHPHSHRGSMQTPSYVLHRPVCRHTARRSSIRRALHSLPTPHLSCAFPTFTST